MTPDDVARAMRLAPLRWVANESLDDRTLFQGQCDDGRHTVLVYEYLGGQIRMRVTDKEQPDSGAPEGHGSIIREMDSYKRYVAAEVICGLLHHPDPPAYCESLAKPWNTAFDGDRIRLDNKQSEFRPS